MIGRARLGLIGLAMVVGVTAPLGAVGLGPLTLSGIIDGPREGFDLILFNPYPEAVDYVVYAVGRDDETAAARVEIYPAESRLGAEQRHHVLVVAGGLTVGESYAFRVCAQRKTPPQGVLINARVCSKITAHRVV